MPRWPRTPSSKSKAFCRKAFGPPGNSKRPLEIGAEYLQEPIKPYAHPYMKTTIELPDDLLIEAKSLAARRKTTLKAIIESALRREIRPACEMGNPDPEKFEVGPFGLLVLKRRPGEKPMTLEDIRRLEEGCDEEDFQRAMKLRGQ